MLRWIPLFSLAPVFYTFIDLSFNTHLISHYINNSPPALEKVIVQQSLPTQEKEGFKFQYTGCERPSSNLVRCNFVVINKQKRRRLAIIRDTTRIIDGAGNEFRPLQVNLGVEKSTQSTYALKHGIIYYATNEISTNAPLKGSAIFQGSIQNPIRLFDMHFDDSQDFHIEFTTEVNAK